MTTGILCATPEEFDALHHRFAFDPQPTTVASFQFWTGHAPDRPRSLILAQSGIGKVNSEHEVALLRSDRLAGRKYFVYCRSCVSHEI